MSDPSPLTLRNALQQSTNKLACTSPSARLDSEILLAYVLQVNRIFLITHEQRLLQNNELSQFNQLIERRHQGEPIAYLMGQKDFWSFTLTVTPDVLIPRPETELLVETVLALDLAQDSHILELGTGSGAIAIALALERPNWSITATDISTAALTIAQTNAKRLHPPHDICWRHSDWFRALPPASFSLIVSNPPYIAEQDPHLNQGGLPFEPHSLALRAGEDGLHDLIQIIQHAPCWLKPNGYLCLEHGYQQAPHVQQFMTKIGFQAIQTLSDLAGHPRVTYGILASE
ncbi:MAG: peptide chain release factor N(5)-glutamine methyltransferase [Legionellales bacterium]|nr:peptide chain release factor N(5)-glutamine methyltransferase [Legionellales bacterium]